MEIAISRWLLLSLFALLVQAQDQTGFLSLDCGLPANSSAYNDPNTNIRYVSDSDYINTGESRSVASEFMIYKRPQWTLRSFPQEIRNCYSISAINDTKYLIRATFLYGNYDGLNKVPQFDLYLGNTRWTTVDGSYYTEIIHIPSINKLQICLINIGQGTPFISSLEFRQLPYLSYFGLYSLYLYGRYNMGSTTNKQYRFPDDIYDRIWDVYNDDSYAQLSTFDSVDADGSNSYHPAAEVMKTAATPNRGTYLNFSWDPSNENDNFYAYMHFAELEKLKSNQFRGFNITHNGDHWDGPVIPEYLSTTTSYELLSSIQPASSHQFSFFPIENSTLPPIINALEIYVGMEISDLESYNGDVDAISNVQSTYGVIKNWEGDPCVPSGYPWSGLNCSSDSVPRILSLNLSSSGLKGEISMHIFSLQMLQTLDLSNNYLTGEVPKFLSQLLHLKNLNLENNNLSGSLPPDLNKKKKNGLLTLSVDGNPNLCTIEPCTKMTPETKTSNKNIIIPVVASVGGLLAFLVIAAIIYWIAKSNKKQGKDVPLTVDQGSSLWKRRQQFTYAEVVMMTNNFERILGKGGFGMVYYGVLDDTQVAVKMISPSAVQGYHQFQAEVTILMRVHHRTLTNLVGYMNDGGHLGLIYEYMAKGNLAEHLSEKSSSILSWEDRLRIAIDAAQGLEYLHHGCKPPIVHRDVKTTNILLTENLNARLSDFGLSKTYPTDDKSYMTTVIVGTPGYLDPEYYTSNRLTEKSDVYGFGISLMEIISCRPVISNTPDRETNYIARWVSTMVDQGDIKTIVDPRLKGAYENNSVCKAVEIALACVSVESSERPTMNQVVIELKNCLAMELNQRSESRPLESKNSFEMMSISMVKNATPSSPMPR